MLNGKSINGAVINGTVAIPFVFATASWSAGASFSLEAERVVSSTVAWDGAVTAVFESDQIRSANWSVSAGSALVMHPNYVAAGNGAWVGSSVLQSIVINQTYSEVEFRLTSILDAIPDATLGEVSFSSTITYTQDAYKIEFLEASWSTSNSALVIDDAELLVTRDGSTDWFGGSNAILTADPSLTSGGVTTHAVAQRINIGVDWEVDPEGVEVQLNDALWFGKASVSGTAHLICAAQASWSSGPSFGGDATVLRPTEASWSGSMALAINPELTVQSTGIALNARGIFSIQEPTFTRAAYGNWSGSAFFEGTANRDGTLSSDLSLSSDLTIGESVRSRLATGSWALSASVAFEAEVSNYAQANWTAFGNSEVTAPAVLSLVPAPAHRSFIVPYSGRSFEVGARIQFFEVAA